MLPPEQAKEFLFLNKIPQADWQLIKGSYSYKDALFYNGIRIYYNGQDGMGVCVSMSGQGCRTFEDVMELEWMGWHDLFNRLLTVDEINITRLDVACDETEGILDMQKIAEATRKGEYVKRLKAWNVDESNKGICTYYGSPQSDIRIRIYDKAAERGKPDEHWIRCELQLRDDLAKEMMIELLKRDNVGESIVVFCTTTYDLFDLKKIQNHIIVETKLLNGGKSLFQLLKR